MEKKRNKLLALLLAVVFMLTLVPQVFAEGDGGNDAIAAGTIEVRPNSFYFWIRNSADSAWIENSTNFNDIERFAEYKFGYTFDLAEGSDPNPEDYIKIEIPQALRDIIALSDESGVIKGYDSDLAEEFDLAQWTLDKDTGIFTIRLLSSAFDETDKSPRFESFNFFFQAGFSSEKISSGDTVEFAFSGEGQIVINFKDDPVVEPVYNPSIKKSGGSYDPYTRKITWTVIVDSDGEENELKGVVVKDILPNGQTYVNGSARFSDSGTDTIEVNSESNAILFKLGNVKGSRTFAFETEAVLGSIPGVNGGSWEWKNEVLLFENNDATGSKLDDDSDTVAYEEDDWFRKVGSFVEKNGNDPAYLTWTITIDPANFGGAIPQGSWFVDLLPVETQEYMSFDQTFQKVNGADTSAGSFVTESGATESYEYRYHFPFRITDTFTFTLRTVIDETFFKEFNSSKAFQNGAKLYVPDSGQDDSSGSGGGPGNGFPGHEPGDGWDGYLVFDIDGTGTAKSSLLKKEGSYDTKDQLITWTVTVNANKTTIFDARILDTIQTNQKFDHSAQKVEVAYGSDEAIPVNAGGAGSPLPYYSYNNTTNELTVYLGNLNLDNSPAVLTFTTLVTNPAHYGQNVKKVVYPNTALLKGKSVASSEDDDITAEAPATVDVTSKVVEKEGIEYNHQTRELSWAIKVNQNQMVMKAVPNSQLGQTVEGITVTDILDDKQAFITDMQITAEYGTGSSGATSITIIKVNDSEELGVNQYKFIEGKLVIRLADQLDENNSPVAISFKTKVADPSIFLTTSGNVTFTNTAKLNYQSAQNHIITEEHQGQYTADNETVKKSGSYNQDEGILTWLLFVNSNGAPMEGAVLKDTFMLEGEFLKDGLILDMESIELYKWPVPPGGHSKPYQESQKGDPVSYALSDLLTLPSESDDFNFKLNLPDIAYESNEPPYGYIIKFDTLLTQGGKYKNKAEFTGNAYQGSSTSNEIQVVWQEGGGQGGGNFGSITVNKIDAETEETIENVQFELWTKDVINNKPGSLYRTGKTNENGQLVFGRLRLGGGSRTYYLRESAAPLGYRPTLDDEGEHIFYEITLSVNPEPNNGNSRDVEIMIENEPLRANISILKVNPDGEGIEGGLFGIYGPDDSEFSEPISEAVANEDGVVTFENMLPGNYKIREINPPPGYLWTGQVVDVTLELDEENNSLDNLEYLDLKYERYIINEYAGKITITKTGASGPLANVTFELLNENKEPYGDSSTGTTGTDGKVTFADLPLGIYYVRETAAPSAYHLNTTLHKVVLTDTYTETDDKPVKGWEQTLLLRNYLLTDSVILTKTDPNGVALDGGWFGIFSNAEATGEPFDKVQADGGQVVFTGLLPGTYYVRELEAPAGYIKSDDIIPVTVSLTGRNGISGEVVKDPIINVWAGHIKLVKLDEKGEPLAGAVFELLDANKEVLKEGTSGKDGIIEFKELPMGTYYLREKTAPSGYDKLEDLTEVVLETGAEADMVKSFEFENKKMTGGKVTVKKVNQGGDLLTGGNFAIYKADDTGFATPLQKVAAEYGIILFTGLEAGDYVVKELEAPAGYSMTNQTVKVTVGISEDNELVDGVAEEALVNDYDGQIIISKTGSGSQPLGGVTFGLFTEADGKKLPFERDGKNYELTSGEDGIVKFLGLPQGVYYVLELAAPAQYQLPGVYHRFHVDYKTDGGVKKWIHTRTISNSLLTDGVILEKVDPDGVALDGGLFGLFSNPAATGEALMEVTAVDGRVVFSNLDPGTYYIRELEAPEGFMLTDEIIKVDVKLDGKNGISNSLSKGSLVNHWIGGIKLVKLDEKGEALAGAVFELLDADKKVIGEGTSGKDGVVEFKELPMGTYYLREKTAPMGYAKLEGLTEVVLKGGLEADMFKSIEFENKKMATGKVTVKKVNKEGDLLTGGYFAIYRADDTAFESPLQKVAAEGGIILFTGLEAGDYVVKELEAPAGYYMTDQTVKVTVGLNEKNELVDGEAKEALVNDRDQSKEESLAKVSLKKVNQYGRKVSGGLFGIYWTDDVRFENPVKTATSLDGLITFEDLEAGEYYIREIEAPDHHILTDEFVKVVLKANPETGLLEDVEIEDPLLNLTPLTLDELDEIENGEKEDPDKEQEDKDDDDLVETGGFFDTAMLWFFGTLLMLAGAILLLRMRADLLRK